MPSLSMDFEVWCACGEGLCNQTENGGPRGYRNRTGITVTPCDKCLAGAEQKGFKEGYDEGHKDAQEAA